MTARAKLEPAALPDWPRLMDRDLAAAYLSVSPNLLERLPIRKLQIAPRRVVYDLKDLDRFVDRLGDGGDSLPSPDQWLGRLVAGNAADRGRARRKA